VQLSIRDSLVGFKWPPHSSLRRTPKEKSSLHLPSDESRRVARSLRFGSAFPPPHGSRREGQTRQREKQ